MMVIPVHGPAYVYGDNQSVLSNTTFPKKKLSRKNHPIACHVVREVVVRNEWLIDFIKCEYNPSDALTKTFPSGETRDRLVGNYSYHIP